MSSTFADQLFQNLDSLKNNSYKLSNDEIKLEGSITGDTNANIYGLNYELGTSSNFIVGEKVGEMSFKLGEMTPLADTDETTFNFNNDKVSGSVVNKGNDLPMLRYDLNITISGLSSSTDYAFNILYDNNVIIRIYKYTDMSHATVSLETSNYKDLPNKEDIVKTKFKVEKNSESDAVPPENSFIEIKDTNGNTLWGFKFIIRTIGGSIVDSITAETGYDILCYKDIFYIDGMGLFILFKKQSLNINFDYDSSTKKIECYFGRSGFITFNNKENTTIDFDYSTNIHIKGKVVADQQFYIYIISSLFGNNNLYLYYNLKEDLIIKTIKSNYFKATILDDDNNKVSLYNVSKPYPALLFISDEMVKPETYTNVINETINNINSTVLNDGVIYTIPRFVKN